MPEPNGGFNFLQFSDLHSHKDTTFDITHARSRLYSFLRDNQDKLNCDYIFITGDIADRCDYSETYAMIAKLREAVGTTSDKAPRVFWAAGNHDISRKKTLRNFIISNIRKNNDPHKEFEKMMFDEESRTILTQTGMSEYLNNYKEICKEAFPENEIPAAHRYIKLEKLNLFVLNTCLTSYDDNDNQNLFITENKMYKLFEQAEPGLPTLVIGHHGREYFSSDEQDRIKDLFENRVDLYLCGHTHRVGYSSIYTSVNEIHQITCGGGALNGYSKLVFMHGSYNLKINKIIITPYSYEDRGDRNWGEDYRLHPKLSVVNHALPLARLDRSSLKTKVKNKLMPDVSLKDILFEKSNDYYIRLISPGGRFAYAKQDERLFAGLKLFEATARLMYDNNDEPRRETESPKNIMHCVLDSDKHALFIGDGGMGKTTSLIKIWQHELDSKLENRKLPLYIPLNEYNIEGAPRFIQQFVIDKYGIDLSKDIAGIKTVLLLDGFNEITKDNRAVVSEIKDYMARRDVQVVLTSRYDFRAVHGFDLLAYTLQPLDEDVIRTYLSSAKIKYEYKMLEILRNPMMLTLHANTSANRKQIEVHFPKLFKFEENSTVADVIKNYMTCQLGRLAIEGAPKEILPTAFAMNHIAPYIAYKLESSGEFSIPRERLNLLIDEYLNEHSKNDYEQAKREFSGVLRSLNAMGEPYQADALAYEIMLTNTQHILIEEDVHFVFRHQYFRDFLSAIHIKKLLEKADYDSNIVKLPDAITSRVLSASMAKMLGECIGEHENARLSHRKTIMHRIIGVIREEKNINAGYALHNIINIWNESRGNAIIGEDLSGLDLTHIPMNGIRFSSDIGATKFDNSKLSIVTFLPMGHNNTVTSAAYSPDGRYIVTASRDNTTRVWDAATGETIKTLEGHKNYVSSAAYSPDGQHIITASRDNSSRVWDTATGKTIITLEGHNQSVNNATYSPDCRYIITASDDGTARVWDATTGETIKALEGHKNIVTSAAYSPDGRYIVTASNDKTARVWDATTGETIRVLKGHNRNVTSVAYSPDGRYIITASRDKTGHIWDAATGETIRVLEGHNRSIISVAYSPDGRYIVTASSDNTARIWDATTGDTIRALEGQGLRYSVTSAAYSPDNRYIVTASSDNTARVWDAATGETIRALEGHRYSVNSTAYSPDSRYIVTASRDKTACIWDAATGETIRALEGHNRSVLSAAYSLDNRYIITASSDKTARVWDTTTGETIWTLEGHKSSVLSATYSPDGRYIVTVSSDNTARIWDAATGETIRVLEGHNSYVTSAAYSPDSRYIVTASKDNTARIWDAATGETIKTLEGHNRSVTSATYSPDGRYIVTSSYDNTARVRDAATGKTIKMLQGHKNYITCATYSPNGRYIITASRDNTARVWDTATGETIRVLEGHKNSVTSAVYSPDGNNIATCSNDGVIMIWDSGNGLKKSTVKIQYYSGLYILGCSFLNAMFTQETLKDIIRQYGGTFFETYLESILILKLAYIEKLEIPSQNQINREQSRGIGSNSLIIAGRNGSGKTMLLNAIDNCLIDFTKNPKKRELTTYELKLKFHGDNKENFIKHFKDYFNIGNMVYMYFPAVGRINSVDKNNNIMAIDALLSKLKADANNQSSNSCEQSKQIIAGFEAILSDLMETKVTIELTSKVLQLYENNRAHSFDHLPHGYTAIVVILGCILKEVINRGGTQETVKGLVIIDEPELHLHVSLQKLFMPTLIKMFPKMQFIVATHSPFLINSATDAVIYNLERREVIYHPNELCNNKLSGWMLEDILNDVNGVDSINTKELDKLLNDFNKAYDKEDKAEANQLYHALKNTLRNDHYLLPGLDIQMAILGGNNEA